MTAGHVRDDTGLTLLEVMIAMSIMTVVTIVSTTGIAQMYHTLNRAETRSAAQTQVGSAMRRLDTEIRYADGISRDDKVAGDWYVEYRMRNTTTREVDCVGLRLTATGRLERRAWAPGAVPVDSPWIPLAVGVGPSPSLAPGESPLKRLDAIETSAFQRLRLRITDAPRGGGPASAMQLDISFTALNTSTVTASDTVCIEGRPT